MPELHRQNAINEMKPLTKYPFIASFGLNKIIAKNFVLKKLIDNFVLKD